MGFTQHSHGFPEFRELYYDDLTLGDTPVGVFQWEWLKKNKFKYTLDEYVSFMELLARRGCRAVAATSGAGQLGRLGARVCPGGLPRLIKPAGPESRTDTAQVGRFTFFITRKSKKNKKKY